MAKLSKARPRTATGKQASPGTRTEAEHKALEHIGAVVEKRAKGKIGEYQDAAPPFAGPSQRRRRPRRRPLPDG